MGIGIEPVADPRFGDEILRLGRFQLELAPKLTDVDAEIFWPLLRIWSPHGLEQRVVWDDAARTPRHAYEQIEFLGREPYLAGAHVDAARIEVDPEVADVDRTHLAARVRSAAPQ